MNHDLRSLLAVFATVSLVACGGVTADPAPDAGAEPSCTDGVSNGDESGVDCGGACGPCGEGETCAVATDCQTGVCTAGVCSAGCDDGVTNADETDTDCGGSTCAACSIDQACALGTDCTTGSCVEAACVTERSCAALRELGVEDSGIYTIDPDGPFAPFDAYCDMQTLGGGWTLIMKLTSGTATFSFDAPHWETEALEVPEDLEPNVGPGGREAKLEAFNRVSGETLRLEWAEPAGYDFFYDELGGRSALALFRGPELLVAGSEGEACNGEAFSNVPGFDPSVMAHGMARQFFGINGSDTGEDGTNRLRFGFASNDETFNSWQPRQAIGTSASIEWGGQTDCAVANNNCGCYGTPLFPSEPVAANLWVR